MIKPKGAFSGGFARGTVLFQAEYPHAPAHLDIVALVEAHGLYPSSIYHQLVAAVPGLQKPGAIGKAEDRVLWREGGVLNHQIVIHRPPD